TSLSALHAVIPPELFKPSISRALRALGLTLVLTAASLILAVFAWQQSSWLWMPVSWWASGYTLTSLFVVAHDCGHLAFLRSRRANFWLGHTLMLPTLYPFHAWRFSHNAHHGRTNCLDDSNDTIYSDNAWLPLSATRLREKAKTQPALAALYVLCRVLIPLGSALHALVMHYWPFWYR